MLAASVLTLLLGLAGPADAAKSPAPAPLVDISLPNLVKQPSTVPSHPVKLEVPGLAKVEVGLPDVGALLGGNKAASAAPEPAESSAPGKPSRPSRPTAIAAPATARPSASAPVSRAPRATADAGSTPTSSSSASQNAAPRTAAPVAAEAPVRRGSDASEPEAKPPAAAKAKAAAEVFRGMLKGNLPVWLLVGIVVACAAGTIVVVRSGRRQDAS